MPRALLFALSLCAAFAALLGATVAAGSHAARVASASAGNAPRLPMVQCDFTPLSFSFSGRGNAAITRPLSVTAGDTFEQFIAPPITATAASQAYVTVNESYGGTVSGGITGTFTLTNLNGILVTAPEGLITSPRGFQLQKLVINNPSGTITTVVALNIASFISVPPYYPRAVNGYLHSIATSGAYAQYKFNGTINGVIYPSASDLTFSGSVAGRSRTR
jgi:hypothetical protein